MKVFITGATGFVGGRVAQALIDRGDDVTILARSPDKAAKAFPSAQIVGGEIGRLGSKVFEMMKGMEGVIHCAAHVAPVGAWEDFDRVNIHGTQELLQASIKSGVRAFVNFSSPSIYVDYTDRIGIKESDPLPTKQVSMYGRSKVIADELIALACQQGLNACSLRPRGVIGSGDRNILPRMMRAASSGYMPVIRNGLPLLDLTVIENLVEATVTALDRSEQLRGEIINISNGEPLSVRAIAEQLFKQQGQKVKFVSIPWPLVRLTGRCLESWYAQFAAGSEPPLTVYAAGLSAFSQVLDISKARRLLNYQPRRSVAEGISDFVRAVN